MSESKAVSTKLVSSSYTSASSSTTCSVKTTSTSMVHKSSSKKVVTSSGAQGSGINFDAEMEKMKLHLDDQIGQMKAQMMSLLPMPRGSGQGSLGEQLITLDNKSIQQYIDDVNKDKVRFNFDVHEFAQESVTVKSDGNKIHVHATKQVKKGDDETNEEYSRVYELPSGVDAQRVTSSIEKGGNILTIELPIDQK